jgi:hypothetical protein
MSGIMKNDFFKRNSSTTVTTYVQAKYDPPSEEEANEKFDKSNADPSFSIFFLSSGVFDVTIVPELSSYTLAGVQTRLVTFPALDEYLLTALQAELQPSRYTFIEGVPPGPHHHWHRGPQGRGGEGNETSSPDASSGWIVCFGNVMISLAAMHRCAEDWRFMALLDRNGRFKARVEGPV